MIQSGILLNETQWTKMFHIEKSLQKRLAQTRSFARKIRGCFQHIISLFDFNTILLNQ